MKKVAIITDSIGQVPQEISHRYDIKLMPLSITIEGKTYPGNKVNLAEWKEANLPTSSSILIGVFIETYRELSRK